MLEFSFTPEQEAIREAVTRLCADFPDEYWLERDREGGYPLDFHAAFAKAGQFKKTALKLYIRESATVDRPMSVFSGDLAAGTYVFGAQDSGNNFYTIAAMGK